MQEKIKKTEEKISGHKQQLNEHLSGKIEKRRLQFEDKHENEQRIKALRSNYHKALIDKHLTKEKKISEMKRIWLNKEKEPVDQLYGSLVQ